MPDMPIEPAVLRGLLAGHHVVLEEVDQRILAVRCWGGSNADAGALLGYTEARIRAKFERIEDSGAQFASIAEPWPNPGNGSRTAYQSQAWTNIWRAISANHGIVW